MVLNRLIMEILEIMEIKHKLMVEASLENWFLIDGWFDRHEIEIIVAHWTEPSAKTSSICIIFEFIGSEIEQELYKKRFKNTWNEQVDIFELQ